MPWQASLLCRDRIKITEHFQIKYIDDLNLAMFNTVCNGVARENGDSEVGLDCLADCSGGTQNCAGTELGYFDILLCQKVL